jgi:hypothetical protein
LPNFAVKLIKLLQTAPDTLIYSPGRSVSEFLDPRMWEMCHNGTNGPNGPLPFLNTAPPEMSIKPFIETLTGNNWIFWIILAGFTILTITRYYHERRLKLLGQSIWKRSAAQQLIRESPLHGHRSFFPLFLIYIISMTLLVYEAAEITSPGSSEGLKTLLLFAEIIGAYLLYTFLKIMIIRLISITFKNPETAKEYIQNILIYNLALGILLLPLILLMVYTLHEVFLYLAVFVVVITLGLRFIRGMAIGLSDSKFTLFHLFLYLCTLEILPLAFVAKLLSKYFFS